MSETATHHPDPERTKDPATPLSIDNTKDASDIKSDLAISPGENHLTNSTEDAEEYSPDDIKHLEETGQRLTNELIQKGDFKKEFEEANKAIQRTFSSNLPVSVKMRMMEAAMDKLKTKMNCIREYNKAIKVKIINIRKKKGRNVPEGGDNSNRLGNRAEVGISYADRPDSTRDGFKNLQALAEATSPTENKIQYSNSEEAAKAKTEEIKRVSEELKDENEKMEETIAQLKQQRNVLLVTIEDMRDDIDDMQYLIKEKKNQLDKKVSYTEELRQKISKDSLVKPSKPGSTTQRKTISESTGGLTTVRNHLPTAIGEKINDISVSVFNTSVFQDVSSKLGQVFGSVGRALGIRRDDLNSDQILSSDFMREINHQPPPTGRPTTTTNNESRTRNVRMLSPQARIPTANVPKTHNRGVSTNPSKSGSTSANKSGSINANKSASTSANKSHTSSVSRAPK